MDKKDTRFTVRTSDDFHKEVQARAAREGRSITEVILGLLAAWLQGKAKPSDG